MKRWQQLLSFYLVLCVAFAGAVGISPVLHVMVEHGGRGHTHSHAAFQTGDKVISEHAHPHPHPHYGLVSDSNDELARLFAEKYPQPKLFGLELADVYRAVGSWIGHAFDHLPQAPANNDGEGHTHHSLAQMLLSGTVEGVADVPPLIFAPAVVTLSTAASSESFVESGLDAQTASRAPPGRA